MGASGEAVLTTVIMQFVVGAIAVLAFSFLRRLKWAEKFYAPRRWVGGGAPVLRVCPLPRNYRPPRSFLYNCCSTVCLFVKPHPAPDLCQSSTI